MPPLNTAAITLRRIPDIPDKPRKGYTPFPHHLADRLHLFGKGPALPVYIAILSVARGDSHTWPSQTTLSRMTGYSPDRIRLAIHRLHKMGLLSVKTINRENHYFLAPILPPKTSPHTQGA